MVWQSEHSYQRLDDSFPQRGLNTAASSAYRVQRWQHSELLRLVAEPLNTLPFRTKACQSLSCWNAEVDEARILRHTTLGGDTRRTMPIFSGRGDRMDFGFPAPPGRSGQTAKGDIGWTPSNHAQSNNSRLDSYFTCKPYSKVPSTDKLIRSAISQLSAELENQPGVPESLSPSSTISTVQDYGTPPTPTAATGPYPFELLALKTTLSLVPAPSTLRDEQQQRPRIQQRMTTNRKLTMVRQHQYRGSKLRTEVRFDDDSFQMPHTVNAAEFSSWGRSPSPSPWPSSYNHLSTAGHGVDVYCEYDDHDCTRQEPPPERPYYPSLATQACIRMPQQAFREEREAEWNYRFPTSEAFKHEGKECVSPVCSAPGSGYNSHITTPFGTPPDSPADTPPGSKPASLRIIKRGGGAFEGMDIDKDFDGGPVDSMDALTAHPGGTRQSSLNTHSQTQLANKTSVPFWRQRSADKAFAKGLLEREKVNGVLFPSHPESIDSGSQASQSAATDSHCIRLSKLKKIFGSEKGKTRKQTPRAPPNAE
ncbi:uncharacterized protein M421DRAFT_342999 [Didymella exigua CBS 183.55]|uniref:Uncharacterized protein n=1 Tax=Didymella exigua CBS 183.55 TaxID=1150837 RepID=A0A6A5RV96_9PLEO|nr:uncharacterized protein M421DRAFT_342999 [Didymella exigua CBS 183.55]KAF1931280.1 hypothetical protein M421DRAFT_342999 [Didymella exigua CBS 183.55]